MAKKRTFGNFFSFRWMITPDIIKVVYVLNLILYNIANILTTFALIAAVIMFWDQTDLGTTWMIVIIVLWVIWRLIWWITANILLRMYYELVILPFSIHEMLSTVEGEVRDMNRRTDPSKKK